MKYKKLRISILFVICMTLIIAPKVNAKTSIEIKANGNIYTNKTVSEFFDESMAMKNTGESLEGSNVNVHMATNLDWAIVSYFSNSAYGTNGEGKNTGTAITIDGKTGHYSTNGNITGVMDWGMNRTYTAGLRTDYQDITDETIKGNISSLVANVNNNRYVDIFPIANWRNIQSIAAYSQWYHDPLSVYTGGTNAIIGCRARLFAMQSNTGAATKEYTFRPVITGN